MRVENYGVSMKTDYFSLKSSKAGLADGGADVQNMSSMDLTNGTASMVSFKGDSKIKEIEESAVIKELGASVLKGLSVAVGTIGNLNSKNVIDEFEAEALAFKTTAYVKTDRGEIDLDLNVSLSRSFVQYHQISIEESRREEAMAKLIDPLVLDFSGTLPSLGSKTFSFDIDADGERDQISTLGETSAFLAFDKNKNGFIDSGTELFGTKSGNGFKDLEAYDNDKNGWIDKNDKIFDKLRVWIKSDTKDELLAIGEVGIGAVFLGSVYSPFEMKDSSNQRLGVLRQSGFFLFENTKGGVISHIDLAVFKEEQSEKSVLNVNNEISKILGINAYVLHANNSGKTQESEIEKLQKLLSSLENRLKNAKSEQEKIALQGQISAIQAQILSSLSSQII